MNPILAEIKKKAEAGDAVAQNFLGVMYAKGAGTPKDNAEAVKWYRKAAEQGDAEAQYILGGMYAKGLGVPEDNAEAAKWYRKAADQGDAKAQYSLGEMCLYPTHYAYAVKWYRLAAEQGYAIAQSQLGYMYSEGKGVPKDLVQAHVWWNLSGTCVWWNILNKRGDEHAREDLAILEKQMTSEQKAEAMKLARELFAKLPKGK